MRLNTKRKFFLNSIYTLGFLISFGIPMFYLTNIITENIKYQDGKSIVINIALVGFIGMVIMLLVYLKWIKKVFNRKLQALAVVNELGMYSSKQPIWNRFIKTIEYIYPFLTTLLFFSILNMIFTQYEIFETLTKMNKLLIQLLISGAVIFLIADILKINMMNKQKVEDTLDSEIKKDKLYLKRIKNNKKTELRALEIQKELDNIRNK